MIFALAFDGVAPACSAQPLTSIPSGPAYVDQIVERGLTSDDQLRAGFIASHDVTTLSLKNDQDARAARIYMNRLITTTARDSIVARSST